MRRALLSSIVVVALALPSPARAQAKPKPPAKPAPAKPPPTTPEAAPAAAPASAPVGKADKVTISIVEIAGGNLYIKPGSASGVRRNSRVTIEGRTYTVTSSTTNFAVIELGDTPAPKETAAGTATTVSEEEDRPKELPPPRPIEQLRGQLGAWHAPAEFQHPKFVPLGLPDHDRRYDLLVYGYVGGEHALGPRGGGYVRGEVGVRMHVEPFSAPVMLDVDGGAQRWFGAGIYGRDGARPTLRIRELQLGYGNPARNFAALGRIKYAAATLGTLDGLRARAALGDFSVAAFGGLLPDPLLGSLSTDAQRFGVEGGFSKPELALRPEAGLVVHGSTYKGKLDERRISALVNVYPGESRAGAHVEISSFDKDNPWGVSPLELTAVGVDGTARAGVFQFGARADIRQQERSMYLAAFLPPSWFCLREAGAAPAPGNPPNPDVCDPRWTTLYQAGLDAGLTTDHFALFLGGIGSKNLVRGSAPSNAGAFVDARVLRIYKGLRLEASGTASGGTYMDMFSVGGGPGITTLADRLDAAVYYRRTALKYHVGESLGGNSFGGYATLLPKNDVVVSAQAEASQGDDLKAIMGTLVLVWRPRL